METMIVMSSGAIRSDRGGAALPPFGSALRPRLGTADATGVATVVGGARGTATAPTPDLPLDVTSARTS